MYAKKQDRVTQKQVFFTTWICNNGLDFELDSHRLREFLEFSSAKYVTKISKKIQSLGLE